MIDRFHMKNVRIDVSDNTGSSRRSARLVFISGGSAALVAVAILYQLLVPPVVGLADNGSYQRVMGPVGMRHTVEDLDEVHFNHLRTEYAVGPGPTAGAELDYPSSERLFAQVALWADRLLTDPSWFDIRAVGLVHATTLLIGVTATFLGLRRIPAVAWTVVLAWLVVILTDAGYVSVLNSFHGEAAAVVGVILALGAAVLAVTSGQQSVVLAALGVFAVAGAITVSATHELVALSVPFAAVAVLVAWQRSGRVVWLAATAAVVLIVGTATWTWARTPPGASEVGAYNIVFVDLLPRAEDPARTLRDLGVDPGLARYAGTGYHHPGSPRDDPDLRAAFFAQVDTTTLLRFFALHPGELIHQLARNADAALHLRPEFLANLTRDASPEPRSQYPNFSLWSSVHAFVLPGSIVFIAVVLLAALAVSVIEMRRRHDRGLKGSSLPGLLGLVAIAAGLAYAGPVLLGGETEVTLRTIPFALLFDLSLVGLVAWALCRVAAHGEAATRVTAPSDDVPAERAAKRPRVR
ncbi:MAG: hypothetical protein KY437_03525 [Actinobacteria bacterium]|nr:hypothetical protein [Actinomycetota bacterium]